MTIRDEFVAAGEQYAAELRARKNSTPETNAAAFAEFAQAFAQNEENNND